MYIIRLPFKGDLQSAIKADGSIAYTHFKSFEEYAAANHEPGTELKIVSWEEFDKLHKDYYNSPFEEVTEEKWYEYYCQLPPVKPRYLNDHIFCDFSSEAMSGSMHACYIHDKEHGKFYCGRKHIFMKPEDLLQEFIKDTVK